MRVAFIRGLGGVIVGSVAVMGATGLVGRVMRQVLDDRKFPIDQIKFLASAKSAGRTIRFRGEDVPVEAAGPNAFKGVDIVLSSTPASTSRELSPIAAREGAVVIDNSSAFRMDPNVPLVVPEVNPDAITRHQGIIANPNCSTIQMVVALKPLHDLARIKRIIVSTYQASSGKGAKGLSELEQQFECVGKGLPVPPATAHKHILIHNCIPNDWTMGEEGNSEEEIKMVRETKKIMGEESLLVNATCVRVPVRTGHSESINVEFHEPISVEEARAALSKAPGVVLLDEPSAGKVPLVEVAVGRDDVFVGRIRRDPTVRHGLNLWVVADNLRKGAATNAVQIAECLLALAPTAGRAQ